MEKLSALAMSLGSKALIILIISRCDPKRPKLPSMLLSLFTLNLFFQYFRAIGMTRQLTSIIGRKYLDMLVARVALLSRRSEFEPCPLQAIHRKVKRSSM